MKIYTPVLHCCLPTQTLAPNHPPRERISLPGRCTLLQSPRERVYRYHCCMHARTLVSPLAAFAEARKATQSAHRSLPAISHAREATNRQQHQPLFKMSQQQARRQTSHRQVVNSGSRSASPLSNRQVVNSGSSTSGMAILVEVHALCSTQARPRRLQVFVQSRKAWPLRRQPLCP